MNTVLEDGGLVDGSFSSIWNNHEVKAPLLFIWIVGYRIVFFGLNVYNICNGDALEYNAWYNL